MKSLLVVIISWNRPRFLRQTIDSLFEQLEPADSDLIVVDNGSERDTVDLIKGERRLKDYRLLETNLGLNGALEAVLTDKVLSQYEQILISDADMRYRRPLRLATDLLASVPTVGAVSYQHSPEHAVSGDLLFEGLIWLTKWSERGCALVLRTADYQRLRPLPIENLKDFDWWVVRDAPQSLQRRRLRVAVLPGGAWHLGWHQGDSTWQAMETPEFDEFKVQDVLS